MAIRINEYHARKFDLRQQTNMPPNIEQFVASVAVPLGWFYAIVCAANLVAAGGALRVRGYRRAAAWSLTAALFGVFACLAMMGKPPQMPSACKQAIDAVLGPVSYTLGALVGLMLFYLGRKFFVKTVVAWVALNMSLMFMGMSLTDPQFAATTTNPDNLAVVAMVYLLAFFTWLATAQAVENDRRREQGLPPMEKQHDRKILVWPDLVYTELICMVLLCTLLIVWALSVPAPLEQPANPAVTPNPSKAPWYFLGLQEMLVFSDAWHAGVVVPCLIVLGLMLIPYIDRNSQGSGYYTITQRRFAYLVFQFGFLGLWILLILVGTFMRGPNWSFFGLYEVRDPHKIVTLSNVTLSQYFWVSMLGVELPGVPAACGWLSRLGHVFWREIAGLVLLGIYFLAVPPLLGRTVFRQFRQDMGRWRYVAMVLLLLMMLTLPLKIILRWTFGLNYIVSMPEYFFNF